MYLRQRRGALRVARSVAASVSDKRKQETINSATLFKEPAHILDGSAPSRCTTGRTCRASNCEHIIHEKNCCYCDCACSELDDATTSPSFDLDVFPDDSIILWCVVNMEFAQVTVASIIVTRNCCAAPKFQRVLKRYNITISWWITVSDWAAKHVYLWWTHLMDR